MPALTFLCPGCNAALRVRDGTSVGMLIDCPDCGQPLRIQSNATGQLAVQLVDPALRLRPRIPAPSADPQGAAPAGSPPASALPPPAPTSPAAARRAQWIAWSVAAVCLLVLVGVLSRERRTPSVPEPANDASTPTTASAPPAVTPAPAATIPDKVVPAPGRSPLEQRLTQLGNLVLAQAQSEGHFPAGRSAAADVRPEDQFSWLAALDAAHGTVREPFWDRAWRDPLNDRFVRRRMELFQNPAVRQLTSADGYPATHFVGVAGVGADAADLPANHPRAGIFANTRTTRPDDVQDGLSHTMLLAGVQEELGSWAAAGRATLRPFAREPYVNGPDGFGTGQPASMLVLMADGSVRTVAAGTDPRVVRRMAAMADGLPLDPAVEGEPGDRPATPPGPMPPQVADAVEPAPPAVPPAVAETAPVKPAVQEKVDIVAALAQKIRLIDQSTPAPLVQLLVQVEALSGVHIEFDRAELGSAAARLDAPVTLRLQQVTVGEILRELLKRGNLSYRIEDRQIRVIAEPAG